MTTTTTAPTVSQFVFPAAAALLLREHTWMSDVAITNWLRNYGASGEDFWIKSRKPDNHHFHFIPSQGGWRVISGRLNWQQARDAGTLPPFD
jgi:hypothetical protein